ncbi:hypothetical protein SAMN05216390_101481 [Lachnospiraceae bacterium KH1T2]|nr:hypothetical protein SAMN05216390_101481 [Lachnospiraceae bacterium KH1T2]
MQEIEFYCKKCKKSMKMAYALTGDMDTPAMNGIIIRCHTHKCTRAVTLKNFTERDILKRADLHGKCYL